jgi:tetratricopeptide (TPR) repeat protein
MADTSAAAAALAAALAATDRPKELLAQGLPCLPIELLVALHLEVRQAMLGDIPRAARAAAAARAVAARHPDDHFIQAQAHWTSGNAVLYVPDYDAALAAYDAALAAYELGLVQGLLQRPPLDARATHINRVFCLSELGRYEEALRAIADAQGWLDEHPDPYADLTLLLNRSQLAGTMGDNAQMLALADATIALALKLDFPDRAAQGWVNRASACVFLGRYPEAEVAVCHALELAAEVDDPLTAARARVARAMLLHAQGRLFAALAELREAADGFAQAPGERAILFLEESTISAQLQQWDEALTAAGTAAHLFREQRLPSYSAEAALRAARIAAQHGRGSVARGLLGLARTQLQGESHPLLGPEADLTEALLVTLERRPEGAAGLRKRRAAHGKARRAIARLRRLGLAQAAAEGLLIQAALEVQIGEPERAIAAYQQLRVAGSPAVRLDALGALGALLPPPEALPVLEVAAQLAVEQRRSLPMEELQARYSAETAPHHVRLAACALALGDLERAADALWTAKAGPILDLRAAGAARHDPNERVSTIKADLGRLSRLYDDHVRSERLATDERQLERAAHHRESAQSMLQELERRAVELTTQLRALGDRGGQRPVPRFPEVQAALGSSTGLLEWFEAEGALYAMLITPAPAPLVRRVAETRAVAVLLDRWSLIAHRHQGAAQRGGREPVAQALGALVKLLFSPWRDELAGLTELVVAPTGILYQVPWAALIALEDERLAVSLTPSGGLWAAPPEAPSGSIAAPRVLGFAGDGPGRLEHLEAELAAIAAVFPTAELVHEARSTDLQDRPPPILLHIGSHARTLPSAPLCSTIALADGPFLLYEAHRLNLRGTALVVLSACETAMRPDHGDMALALAGAFLCAGAGAVVASLWPVDDAATASLMRHFYPSLAAGAAPTNALRQAVTAIRNHYPLDWAAFQLWVGSRDAATSALPGLAAENVDRHL